MLSEHEEKRSELVKIRVTPSELRLYEDQAEVRARDGVRDGVSGFLRKAARDWIERAQKKKGRA